VTGSTPDITACYAQFDWYEHVFYWDPAVKFPDDRKLIGRWLGVAEVAIDELAFYILTKTCKVIIGSLFGPYVRTIGMILVRYIIRLQTRTHHQSESALEIL
jgi:hypothetical protein